MTTVRETQLDRLRILFVTAGPTGLFSGDMRRAGFGNPSQRVEELEAEGWRFREEREPYPSGRGVGKRWWLISRPTPSLAEVAEVVRAQVPATRDETFESAPTLISARTPGRAAVVAPSPPGPRVDGRLFDVDEYRPTSASVYREQEAA